MNATKKIGIWMDYSTAHIMEFSEEPHEIETIESNLISKLTAQEKNKGEKHLHSVEKQCKADYFKKIAAIILNYDKVLLFGPDVKVEIQWLVYEQERYESANAPDMDNIIKPILDGLSGPDGILIDDCQVQTIGSHWIDWTKREHQINISIRYIPDDFVSKKNLMFVNLGNNLFMPIHSDLPWKVKELLIDHLEKGMFLRDQMLSKTGNYYQAKLFMSIQRLFHKSRVFDNFKCTEIADFRTIIESEKEL